MPKAAASSKLTWEMIRAGAHAFDEHVSPDGLGTARDPTDIVEVIFRMMVARSPSPTLVIPDVPEGKGKQSMGNAIERLGQNLIGIHLRKGD